MMRERHTDNKRETYPKHRIIHDSNQITDVSQFENERLYQRMRKVNGKITEGEIFTFVESSDEETIKTKNKEGKLIDYPLADMGIIIYKPGLTWNPHNYVIPL